MPWMGKSVTIVRANSISTSERSSVAMILRYSVAVGRRVSVCTRRWAPAEVTTAIGSSEPLRLPQEPLVALLSDQGSQSVGLAAPCAINTFAKAAIGVEAHPNRPLFEGADLLDDCRLGRDRVQHLLHVGRSVVGADDRSDRPIPI